LKERPVIVMANQLIRESGAIFPRSARFGGISRLFFLLEIALSAAYAISRTRKM
jgi:hypothetical protein